jgi:hypothetical protein
VQRLLFVVILAIVVIGLPLSVLSDTAISSGDTAGSTNEVTSNLSRMGNSSASATITITMTGDE